MSNIMSVSTIIPTYNGRKLLEQHLPTVLRALRDGDELIIVDDASQDESSNWLKYDCMREHVILLTLFNFYLLRPHITINKVLFIYIL